MRGLLVFVCRRCSLVAAMLLCCSYHLKQQTPPAYQLLVWIMRAKWEQPKPLCKAMGLWESKPDRPHCYTPPLPFTTQPITTTVSLSSICYHGHHTSLWAPVWMQVVFLHPKDNDGVLMELEQVGGSHH